MTLSHFTLALKLLAPVFLAVSAIHFFFGVGAEVMVGAILPSNVVVEPTLNSQNRFYGVSYALYGVLLWLCATDIKRFEPVLNAVLWVTFLASIARVITWLQYGSPAPFVIFLMATELICPPVVGLWYAKVKNAS